MMSVNCDEDVYRTEPFASRGQAVVIGSGIAGLSAARVLAKYYAQVTVLDRDFLPAGPEFRAGIPQAYHAHTLLPYGQRILDRLFPGLVDQLLAEGAQEIDAAHETASFGQGGWLAPEPHTAQPTISCSRPMLENLLYRRTADVAQVRVLQGVEVMGLVVDEAHSRVTGIRIRRRQPGAAAPEAPALPQELAAVNTSAGLVLPADVVVDASGRSSKTPQWLAGLGFTPPEEWRIDAHAGYASRIFRQPAGYARSWKKLYINPYPPDNLRGGVIVPLENDRWHVTLIGVGGDYPPTDECGFLEFARSLPTPELYEAIRAAEPLSRITGFRKNENRVRRFENLPRYLEGLLVLGDAAFAMNPVYALGMTAAAIASQVLDQVLQARRCTPGVDGLASSFQKELLERMSVLWQQAVGADWRWADTEISDNTETLADPAKNLA